MRQKRQSLPGSVIVWSPWSIALSETITLEPSLCQRSILPKLRDQFREGLRSHVPGAFEGIIQIRQHEVGKGEEHGHDRDGHQSQRNIAERKKEKQKQDHRCRKSDKQQKCLRHSLRAEGKPFITVRARLIRDL